MSTSAPCAADRALAALLPLLDPRLSAALSDRYGALRGRVPPLELGPAQHLVLVGQRAAGKSRALPVLAGLLGREGVDLDLEIARRAGRPIAAWLTTDPAGFRQAEREAFAALPPGRVIAAGGGFLSLHRDLLAGHVAVEVPVSFRTYRERLLHDASRPRLRPALPLEEELRTVWRDRAFAHREAGAWPLPDLLAALACRDE